MVVRDASSDPSAFRHAARVAPMDTRTIYVTRWVRSHDGVLGWCRDLFGRDHDAAPVEGFDDLFCAALCAPEGVEAGVLSEPTTEPASR